jgi:hypothetical protein
MDVNKKTSFDIIGTERVNICDVDDFLYNFDDRAGIQGGIVHPLYDNKLGFDELFVNVDDILTLIKFKHIVY